MAWFHERERRFVHHRSTSISVSCLLLGSNWSDRTGFPPHMSRWRVAEKSSIENSQWRVAEKRCAPHTYSVSLLCAHVRPIHTASLSSAFPSSHVQMASRREEMCAPTHTHTPTHLSLSSSAWWLVCRRMCALADEALGCGHKTRRCFNSSSCKMCCHSCPLISLSE